MRHFTLICCLITAFCSQAQKLKLVKNEVAGPLRSYERYHVLDSNINIRHGKYEKDYDGRFKSIGQYINGVKSGIWMYTRNGVVVQKIDFDKHEVIYSEDPKRFEPLKSWLIKDDTLIENTTGVTPHIEGSPWKIAFYFQRLLRYPADARRSGTQGTVEISATVTESGELIDEKIETGPGKGCDEEALRVVKLLPDDWLPAWIDGKPVRTRVIIPVTFKLEY